jgi:hypothetical protein
VAGSISAKCLSLSSPWHFLKPETALRNLNITIDVCLKLPSLRRRRLSVALHSLSTSHFLVGGAIRSFGAESPLPWTVLCTISSPLQPSIMYRYTAGKLPLRAAQASRYFHTTPSSQALSGARQNALTAGRKPLAVMARSSSLRRSYAMAAEESNKGVVCALHTPQCVAGQQS